MYYTEVFNLSDFLNQMELIGGRFVVFQYDTDIIALLGLGAYSQCIIKADKSVYYDYLQSQFSSASEALGWKHSLIQGANSPIRDFGTIITDGDIESLFAVPDIIPDIFDSQLIIYAIIAIIIFFGVMLLL